MSDTDFYARLPICETFDGVIQPHSYRPLPSDWHIVVADVRNSTPAIRDGMYKDVNTLGASSIVAVLNALKDHEIPFIFAGDGAIMAVPDCLVGRTKEALLATKLMALKRFKLDLRIGTVPVHVLRARDLDASVARYRVSTDMVLASFSGRGIEYAEQVVKEKATCAEVLELGLDEIPRADFGGLECRWHDMPARPGEVVCLIVKCVMEDPERSERVYEGLVSEIRRLYGDEQSAHPLHHRNIKPSVACWNLRSEALARAPQDSRFQYLSYLRYLLKLRIEGFKSALSLWTGSAPAQWEDYKAILVKNTDYRRFLGSYRHVLSGTSEQRAALESYLESCFERGEIAYGMHVSDRVLMTCLVFNREGQRLHFLDGADGGFALAAGDMKERLCAVSAPG